MIRYSLKFALVSSLLAPLAALAGSGKGATTVVVEETKDSGALFDSLGVTLTEAYDSKYVYRGTYLGDHLVSTRIDAAVPINDLLSVTAGAWYATSADNSFPPNELDLYAALNVKLDPVTLSLGYTWYHFSGADGFSDINEPYVALAYALGNLGLTAGAYYDDVTEGFYFETGAAYTYAVTEWLSLVPAVVVGYGSDYYGVSGFNHVQPKLSAPIKLTDYATLTPYISYIAPLGDLDDSQDDHLIGGVNLVLTF